MLDLRDFLHSIDILYNNRIKEPVKLNYFNRVFGEIITNDNVEYLFEKRFVDNIRSSNVEKIMYNDETKDMFIQFTDGEIYTYFDVSFNLFLNVSGGNATCITSGESKYGSWYEGKTPSVGAAVHSYLVKRNVRYKKGGTLS